MQPLIYALPNSDSSILLDRIQFYLDSNPSPRLIKYGFNTINNKIDLIALTSVSYYKTGLNFDFERTDAKSIFTMGNALFNISTFNRIFAEIWEILALFDLLNPRLVYTSNPDDVKAIFATSRALGFTSGAPQVISDPSSLSKWVDEKGGAKGDEDDNEDENNSDETEDEKYPSDDPNSLLNHYGGLASQPVDLIIKRYSNINLDENALIKLIIADLPKILQLMANGTNVIIQLFNLETQTSAEIIYYLSSLFSEAYLVRPSVTSEFSDVKYLVLINTLLDPEAKKTLASSVTALSSLNKDIRDSYLISFGLEINPDVGTRIQCLNSETTPPRFKKYNRIKAYLDSKVYEGSIYDEMIQAQDVNSDEWITTFGDIPNMKEIADRAIAKSGEKCVKSEDIVNIFSF